jgi:hypothetical protein
MQTHIWMLAGAIAAGACGADETMTSSRANVSTGAAPGASCVQQNLTQPCTCANSGPGAQTCSGGAWTTCSCRVVESGGAGSGGVANPGDTSMASGITPPGNRNATRFDWQRTAESLGSCEAGHYEGTFGGIYGPSIIVVSDLKVIPVFPIDLPGSPGLQFDLAREGSGEVFSVTNGKMNGNALGAFPFTADIVGKLDCEQLTFDARLVNGSYFIGPLEYKFEGPLLATYNKLAHSFVAGTWMVSEPAYPSAGGGGDWSASWKYN